MSTNQSGLSAMGWVRRRYRVVLIGLRNTVRNAWLAIASIAILFVALTMAVSGVASYRGFNVVIAELEKDLGVSVYLLDGTTDAQVQQLRTDLESQDRVFKVNFTSKEEALERAQETILSGDPDLARAAAQTGNVFPASFEVKLLDLDDSQWVVDFVGQDEYSEIVRSATISQQQELAIANFEAAQRAYTTISAVVGIAFGLVAIVVVFNTIRIAIFNRSEEVRIMKLLGAPRSFIRQPFMVEAAVYGLAAATLTILAMLVAVRFVPEATLDDGTTTTLLGGIVGTVYDELIDLFDANKFMIMLTIIAAGVGASVLVSRLALHKYLRFRDW